MSTEAPRKGSVLVVDDDSAIRLLLRVNLETSGYEVLEAATLGDARRHLREAPVDVVLLDMHVGHERGEALIDELAEAGVPVALVTGSVEIDAYPGVAAALSKPFTPEELEETVARLAALRRG